MKLVRYVIVTLLVSKKFCSPYVSSNNSELLECHKGSTFAEISYITPKNPKVKSKNPINSQTLHEIHAKSGYSHSYGEIHTNLCGHHVKSRNPARNLVGNTEIILVRLYKRLNEFQ